MREGNDAGTGRRLTLEGVELEIEGPGSRLITLDRERHVLDVFIDGAVSDYAADGAARYAEPCPPRSWRILRAGTVDTVETVRTGTTLRASIAPPLLARYVEPSVIDAVDGKHRFDEALIGGATILVEHLARLEPRDGALEGAVAGTDELTRHACETLLGRLAHDLVRESAADEGRPRAGRPEAVQRALAHVEANLEHALNLERVAGVAGLSRYHFARLFRRSMGTSLQRYVTARRLERARELLLYSDHSLADIAYRIGFGSQSHMTTLFRKHIGRTPGEIRRSALERPASDPDAGGVATAARAPDAGSTSGRSSEPDRTARPDRQESAVTAA